MRRLWGLGSRGLGRRVFEEVWALGFRAWGLGSGAGFRAV